MSARILVAGIGNIFLSDDGFGSEAARRLAAIDLPDGVSVVDYGIRGMHLAYDLLDGYDALVIIDAMPQKGGLPGDVAVMEIGPEDLGTGDFDAHGMEPTAVLASLGNLGGTLPITYVVGCQPGDLDENIGLTPPVAAAVDVAVKAVLNLLDNQLADIPARQPAQPAEHARATANTREGEH
ncbi:MAG: hydrogenase maturation protease [Actinomycetota bacterium]|nr:hydrogenase maturation protease [Actinomycetota bacterium]